MTERAPAGKGGFSLIEMIFAVSIFALVVAQIGGLFIGSQRLLKHAYAEAELSLASRQLRERLLFKARPDEDGKTCAGLLSATGHVVGNSAILATIPNVNNTGVDGTCAASRFTIAQTAGGASVVMDQNNSEARTWLLPLQMGFGWGAAQWSDNAQDGSAFVNEGAFAASQRQYYTLTLRYEANNTEWKERVVVPLFGTAQTKGPENQ